MSGFDKDPQNSHISEFPQIDVPQPTGQLADYINEYNQLAMQQNQNAQLKSHKNFPQKKMKC